MQSGRVGMIRVCVVPVVDPGCERERYGYARSDKRFEQRTHSGVAIACANGGVYISAIALRDVKAGKLG